MLYRSEALENALFRNKGINRMLVNESTTSRVIEQSKLTTIRTSIFLTSLYLGKKQNPIRRL